MWLSACVGSNPTPRMLLKMKSKTRVKKLMRRKRNPEIVETILKCNKNEKWRGIAGLLSYPKKKMISINLNKLDMLTKEGDTVVVPGKVLSEGHLGKKIRVAALSFSKEAERKLKESRVEAVSILQELKINPKAQGLKIIK